MTLDLSDDEEIGEFIYRTSQTAKLLREKKKKDDEDMYKATDRSIENNSLPINMKEETVKAEVKTEVDVSTDDERSPECVVSSSTGYDPVKSEETDNEEIGTEDTNTSNEQHLPTDSTNDEYGSEMKEIEQQQKTTQSLANDSTQPRASTVQESIKRRYSGKRKRKVDKSNSNRSIQKAIRIECAVEGCTRKAADSGTCWTHGGKNICSQEGCPNQVQKGGVCKRHKEFAVGRSQGTVEKADRMTSSNRRSSHLPVSAEKSNIKSQSAKKKRKVPPREVDESSGSVQKAARIECSIEGCNRKAADSGKCSTKHKGYKYCSHEGCTNKVKSRGVCINHGAIVKIKTCSHEGCTNKRVQGGVCKRHGAVVKRKTCSHERCTKQAQKGGVCCIHARKKDYMTCSVEGCKRKAADSGTCQAKHKGYKYCSQDGCTNQAKKGGVCIRHGAKRETCKHDGCTTLLSKEEFVSSTGPK